MLTTNMKKCVWVVLKNEDDVNRYIETLSYFDGYDRFVEDLDNLNDFDYPFCVLMVDKEPLYGLVGSLIRSCNKILEKEMPLS